MDNLFSAAIPAVTAIIDVDFMTGSSSSKFDQSRGDEYGRQSRIALAGYDACHELCACMLAASAIDVPAPRILVVGAGGTAGEIIAAARLEPSWIFVAADPSPFMAEVARASLAELGSPIGSSSSRAALRRSPAIPPSTQP